MAKLFNVRFLISLKINCQYNYNVSNWGKHCIENESLIVVENGNKGKLAWVYLVHSIEKGHVDMEIKSNKAIFN